MVICAVSRSVSPTAAPPATRKVSAPAFGVLNGGTYQREEVQSPVQQQSLAKATGSPSAVPRKPLPSFRMKAFKNQRQTTFHSLDMHTDRSGEAQVCTSFSLLCHHFHKSRKMQPLCMCSPGTLTMFCYDFQTDPCNFNPQKVDTIPCLLKKLDILPE